MRGNRSTTARAGARKEKETALMLKVHQFDNGDLYEGWWDSQTNRSKAPTFADK